MRSNKTADRVVLELLGGARLVLQRVARGTDAGAFARYLEASTGRATALVVGRVPAIEGSVRLLDARGWTSGAFVGWDAIRATLATPAAQLVVLLDVAAARALSSAAPQVASWAGGIRLPVEAAVRPARTREEEERGRAALQRAMEEEPDRLQKLIGEVIAIDLFSERVFVGRPDAGPWT